MSSLHEVQYFGAVQRWYKPHLELFSDSLALPQGTIDEIRNEVKELLKQQQFAKFLGRLIRIRENEFPEHQEPRFDVYPLQKNEFNDMLFLLINVRNNTLLLQRLIADMEAVRSTESDSQQSSYFEILEKVIVEIRDSKVREEAKRQVLNSVLSWSVSTVLSMPWLGGLSGFIASRGAALAGSVTPAVRGLLFRPKKSRYIHSSQSPPIPSCAL